MKKGVTFLALVILFGACRAQPYRIQKASAFLAVSIPGMAIADEKGNTIDPKPVMDRFIYLECSYPGKPTIDSVLYNGIAFIASIADKEESSTTIGIKKINGQTVRFVPKKGNHTWKIQLQQNNDRQVSHNDIRRIIIKGRLGKQSFKHTLTSETELATADRY